MVKFIKLFFCLAVLLFLLSGRVYALDAETAHPWIAQEAAKIWPFNGSFETCQSGLDEACKEFSRLNDDGTCPEGQQCYLGKFDLLNRSGSLKPTDVCIFEGTSLPVFEFFVEIAGSTWGRACTGISIVEGSLEEDFFPVPGAANVRHTWDPDTDTFAPIKEEFKKGLYEHFDIFSLQDWAALILSTYYATEIDKSSNSAHHFAEEFFTEAVRLYTEGNKPLAYYYLGRAVHLLEDMASPAHPHLDPHNVPFIAPDWDKDLYEDFIQDTLLNARGSEYLSKGQTLFTALQAKALRELFNKMAQKGQYFPTQDGDSNERGIEGEDFNADVKALPQSHPWDLSWKWTVTPKVTYVLGVPTDSSTGLPLDHYEITLFSSGGLTSVRTARRFL